MADCSAKVTMRKASVNNDDVEYYIEDQPREARQRYEIKLKYDKGQKSLPNPYKLSSGWVNDISTWPDITYGDIYNYLIDSPGVYTKHSMKAYKSLDAYRFVQSGHVQEVFYHAVDAENPFCFLKAKVVPSQRVTDKPHQPWICVSKDSGSIYCAHCTCMAGLGEACSHIAAIMFKVQIAVHMGMTTKSSTSDICKWNSAFRKEIEPKTSDEMQSILRAGNRSHPVATVHATSRDPLPPSDILKSLKEVCPTATFFTTIPPVGSQDSNTDLKPKTTEKTPATLTSLYTAANIPNDNCELERMYQDVWSNYSVTPDQASFLEQSTRNQNVCTKWYEHRKGRITASKAHDVYVRRESTKPDKLVQRIVGYQSYDLSKTKAIRWGLDSEETARDRYGQAMKTVHSNFTTRRSGLLIDAKRPYLGASSDGIRECSCCGRGTVEIKCPYKHRHSMIDSAAASDSSFCLDKDLKLQLKHGHKYYTQVQLQMHVHKVQFCDFIVYTERDMIINVIPYNAEYCSQVIKKCETFFTDHILPEILTRRLCRCSASPDTAEEENLYCICQEPAYGKMVQCSNADCPNEWFHYGCMNIRRKPRGAWFCPACKL